MKKLVLCACVLLIALVAIAYGTYEQFQCGVNFEDQYIHTDIQNAIISSRSDIAATGQQINFHTVQGVNLHFGYTQFEAVELHSGGFWVFEIQDREQHVWDYTGQRWKVWIPGQQWVFLDTTLSTTVDVYPMAWPDPE